MAALKYTIVDLKPPSIHITHLVYVDSIDVRLENVVNFEWGGNVCLLNFCNIYILRSHVWIMQSQKGVGGSRDWTGSILLADVTLRCGMYPAGKVDISRHLLLVIFGFPRVTILLASPVRTLVHCVMKPRRPPDFKSSSNINLPCVCFFLFVSFQ